MSCFLVRFLLALHYSLEKLQFITWWANLRLQRIAAEGYKNKSACEHGIELVKKHSVEEEIEYQV